jgi:CHAT domain-containing protein
MLAALVLALPQNFDLEPAPPTPYDRVVELELNADDEPLIAGRGPTVVAEYQVDFEGTLHVWTRSEMDLFLQVQDANEWRTLGEDDDSGGGTTPYLRVKVREGDYLLVLVAPKLDASGPLSLHLMATPESEITRAAATKGEAALLEAGRLVREGNRAAARELLNETAAVLSSTPGAPFSHLMTVSSRDLARRLFDMGDAAGARALFAAVLAACERTLPEDHLERLHAQASLALPMSAMGDLAGARVLFEASIAGYERTLSEDHSFVLLSKSNLALAMHGRGDLAGARALQEAVLAGYERTLPEDDPERLRAQLNLAVSMHNMGDVAGALALREAVLAGCERTLPEHHPHRLQAQSNLANSLRAMGDHAGAHALDEAVLAGYERVLPEDHPNLLAARGNLAVSMNAMGDRAGARRLWEAVLAGFERTLPADHPDLTRARANLAFSMIQLGDPAGARALFEDVLASYERTLPADHPNRLRAQAALAATMLAMGDLAGARALVPALAAGMRGRALASLALAPRQALGAVASESGRLSRVVFLSEASTPTLQRGAFELLETLRLVAGEAARSLSRAETDPELDPILAEAATLRSALNDLVVGAARAGLDGPGSEEFAEELTRLTLRRDALEREASRRLAERGVVTRAVEAASLAAALDDGDAAVGYRRIRQWSFDETGGRAVRGAEHVLAHVLTADGALTRVDLGPASELEDLADAWRAALGAPLLRGVAAREGARSSEVRAGRALRERVLDPVLAAAGAETARLFVCADDLLFLVPLDGLPLGEGAEQEDVARVGDRVRIANEVSFARLLSPSEPDDAGSSLLAVGGIDYDAEAAAPAGLSSSSAPVDWDGETERGSEAGTTRSTPLDSFQKLLQTRIEAETTALLFEDTFRIEPALLVGEATTKLALFAAAPGARYLHLATHGWFAPESVRSTLDAPAGDATFASMSLEDRITGLAPMTLCGLALAGANRGRDSRGRVPGILTAEELCSLDLSQCELAVLSACETNVGIRRAGQGIQSLQAALYAAGARTSITSLWKVDDAATRRLFEVFYTKLWNEQLGKADALWQAKLALRSEGHPPRDWAGWVLTGNPD